jgi:hypothetical protein
MRQLTEAAATSVTAAPTRPPRVRLTDGAHARIDALLE